MRKNQKLVIFVVFVVVILLGGSIAIYSYFGDGNGVPTGLQVEESIDMSYSEWNIGANYKNTKVIEGENGEILVIDGDAYTAKAIRNFNSIDIGKIKMDIRTIVIPTRNLFAMEFRSGTTVLFKLFMRLSSSLTLVVLDGIAITLYDMDVNAIKTIEIFFDLSDSENSIVSVDVDGVTVVDEFPFDAKGKLINNIYIHTSVYGESQTGIKFEYLYNFK